jgi:hypothetical protein
MRKVDQSFFKLGGTKIHVPMKSHGFSILYMVAMCRYKLKIQHSGSSRLCLMIFHSLRRPLVLRFRFLCAPRIKIGIHFPLMSSAMCEGIWPLLNVPGRFVFIFILGRIVCLSAMRLMIWVMRSHAHSCR